MRNKDDHDMAEAIDRYFYMSDSGRIYDNVISSIERRLIEKALQSTEGRQITAARLLGMNRNTLRKKIVRLGINVWSFRR